MILGNLYREKGQVGKAITVHQSLLQRSKLSRLEHAYVLLCLGLDYKRGGFVERALEAFTEVLRLDERFQAITWTEGGTTLVSEFERTKRMRTTWAMDPGSAAPRHGSLLVMSPPAFRR